MKISNKDLDLGLVKRVKAGDYQAFDLLVLKYQSRLISTAFKFVKDQQIAEDLVQDSFIKSFKSIGSFREDSTFYTWIYRITVNTSKNYLVSKKRKDELLLTDISKEENYQEFRNTFEDSETMKDFMRTIPLAIVLIEEIGFAGGLELSKKLK